MSAAAALLAAIRAAPDDDAPRLVYADWLEEHGQPERAEFIRLQCELARSQSPVLEKRQAELLAVHHDAFAGPRAHPGLRFKFVRGFIIGFGHTGCFHQEPSNDHGPSGLLCFRPSGDVVFDTTWGRAEDRILRLVPARSRIPGLFVGRYSVDAINIPMAVEFGCNSIQSSIEFRGFLEGRFLHFDVHDYMNGRFTRQHYFHYPIPGFDSFSET